MAGNSEQDEANQIAREELAFAKERHARWVDLYGPLEENLTRWAQSISGGSYAAKYASEIQRQFSKSKETVRKSLAQRGLDGSNLEAFILSNAELSNAQQIAQVHATADEHVANIQGKILGQGQITDQTNMQFRAQAGQSAQSTLMRSAELSWKRWNETMGQLNIAADTWK